MSREDELREQCKDGLLDGLFAHEVIDHLVDNEDVRRDDARSLVFQVARELGSR